MPWKLCGLCDVRWRGHGACWSCGSAGTISDPPRVQTYAVIVETPYRRPRNPATFRLLM